jgi:hypothetical protein
MASLTEYHQNMKNAIAGIDPADVAELGEDYMVVAAAGLGVGLISGAIGGLDHKIAGFNVPVDGLLSLALGGLGLHLRNDMIKTASIAIGGSASVRTFERFFKKAFGVKGEFEDLGMGQFGGQQAPFQLPGMRPKMGFGASDQDALVEAAKFL